jgi:hypothetical protein
MRTIDEPNKVGNGGGFVAADFFPRVGHSAEEAVMAQMIATLKAAVEAEKAKLLAELSQAAEPQLSAIRREIAACDSLLARLNRSRAA